MTALESVAIPDDVDATALAAFLRAHTDRRLLRDEDREEYVLVDVGGHSGDDDESPSTIIPALENTHGSSSAAAAQRATAAPEPDEFGPPFGQLEFGFDSDGLREQRRKMSEQRQGGDE